MDCKILNAFDQVTIWKILLLLVLPKPFHVQCAFGVLWALSQDAAKQMLKSGFKRKITN